MDEGRKLSTKEKALKINLDRSLYGSFAEIGAGQEVAANFFKAGAASGTVAKTMSAYDMAFSDAIYGKGGRYVCEERLIRMLEKEFGLLGKRLAVREHDTSFFAFADTVETLNFQRTNQGRGWMGLRFQLHPMSEPNECIIHILLNDNENTWQQRAIGIIGVNLIYACLYLHHDMDLFIQSLLDGVVSGSVEIDLLRLTGNDFKHIDNRLLALKLVKIGLCKAAMFGPDGNVLQPSEALYKKNALVMSGRFRPYTNVNEDMLQQSMKSFANDEEVDKNNIINISELSLNTLIDKNGNIDEQDFLDRAEMLCSLGHTVMITNFFDYYYLVPYLSKLTRNQKVGFVLGIPAIERIFDSQQYFKLRGGFLEAFAMLFGTNVRAYVYPTLKSASGELVNCNNLSIPENFKPLFDFLMFNKKLEDLEYASLDYLHLQADDVLELIKQNKKGWEEFVPTKVAEAIKENCLFGFPCEPFLTR
jgi:hypothetical protein